MFSKGSLVLYGTNGVCEITEIARLPFDRSDAEQQYYYLKPLNALDGCVIYAPTVSERRTMRALLSEDEMRLFLGRIPEIEALEIDNEKTRRDLYKSVMQQLSPEGCIALIRSVKMRRGSGARKHLSETDMEFEAMALKNLSMELSCVLNVPLAAAQQMIEERIADAD